jgi:thiamine-monophosphate kinase
VWVSGELGGAALALVHPEMPGPAKRLHEPEPRVVLGERLRGLASAAIDVSDGLAGDLGHILERSNVGAVVEYPRVPRAPEFSEVKDPELEKNCVISGGDDYELLFTVPSQRRALLEKVGGELGIVLTRIGTVNDQVGTLSIVDGDGKSMSFRGGYDHFAR